jgi:Uma2 family endonuclease
MTFLPEAKVKKLAIEGVLDWITEQPEVRRRLREAAQVRPPRQKMTYAEFLAWAEDTRAEWVDGEVIMASPASRKHQIVVGFLYEILQPYVQSHGLGQVLLPPFQMKLERGREPDLLFVTAEHLDRLQETYLDGPADLVVEIVSPESVGRDRGEKFYEYERGGVAEYWLIDPQTRRAEFYQLDSESRYQLVLPDGAGVYRSSVLPGFWLQVKWLWQEPLPHVLSVWRELNLIG